MAFACLCVAFPAGAQLKRLETDDLRLVYLDPIQTYLTPHVARCFLNSMGFQRELFQYTPSQKTTVLLNDFADFGNAGVSVVPRNSLMLQIAPVSFVYETLPANEAVNWTMNHELVHVAAYDQATRGDRFFRGLFAGKVAPIAEQPESVLYNYLTVPRYDAPRWFHEGIAVFIETWMAGGRGRGQGAWDEMVFRSMVRDGSRFYDPLGLASEGTKVDFQLEVNSYLYGTRFMSYLAYHYSPQHLVRWAARTEGSRSYYASQFRQVFGKGLGEAWRDWIAFEREFQNANLEAIRRYPITPYEDVSRQALGSISRAFYVPEQETIYAAFNYPGVVAHIGAISLADGSVRRLQEIKDPLVYIVTSLAYDPESQTLFYTTDNHEYRDVRALDPRTGQSRVLLKEARIGDLVFDRADRSLWGVRHFNGMATLVRIPHPYNEWHEVRSWPYGDTVYDLDVSPDGRRLSASVGEISGRHSLQVFETDALLKGEATPIASTDFGAAIPMNFVFAPDGQSLYGSSYYTGVANVFRYTPETGAKEALSNTETGLFRPIPLAGDSLLVFRYTGEGFVPTRIHARVVDDVNPIQFLGQQLVEKSPELKGWIAASPAKVPLDSMITATGAYRSVRSIGLESVYPVMQGYKDALGVGLRLNFSDPVQLNRASVTASYTPDEALPTEERFHADARYERYDWRLRARYNAGDFYDMFGPTKVSRKGYALGVGYRKGLIYDRPRHLEVDVATTFYWGLDRLPDYQNVPASGKDLLATRARLSYTHLRHSLGNVDEEKGYAWELGIDDDQVNGANFPRFRGSLDLGVPLPIKHSSIFVRGAMGYSPGDRAEPSANFFFGGFGNNWVDHGDEKRYRSYDGFPGVELNEIGGTSFVKAMLEWNLPPIRFRRAGGPAFYLAWARPAVFATGLVTNPDAVEFRRSVSNVGAQLDFKLYALHKLDLMLSVGHALALEEGQPARHETMLSLKVLK